MASCKKNAAEIMTASALTKPHSIADSWSIRHTMRCSSYEKSSILQADWSRRVNLNLPVTHQPDLAIASNSGSLSGFHQSRANCRRLILRCRVIRRQMMLQRIWRLSTLPKHEFRSQALLRNFRTYDAQRPKKLWACAGQSISGVGWIE